jgi:hypothetical protein
MVRLPSERTTSGDVHDPAPPLGHHVRDDGVHEIPWDRRTLAVPLAQLEGVAVDEPTRQAIEDWQYWVA